MIKIFISSPYSGNEEQNVHIQQDCANELINLGFNPFIPLLYHYQQAKHPQLYEVWLAIDLDWISSCDILLRLPGDSPGADREVAHAEKIGIPVVYSIEELIEFVKPKPQYRIIGNVELPEIYKTAYSASTGLNRDFHDKRKNKL
jgi:hypothetical protein